MATDDVTNLIDDAELRRTTYVQGQPMALRLAPCRSCGARMRSISMSGEAVEGVCLRCGEQLVAPLATETVELIGIVPFAPR